MRGIKKLGQLLLFPVLILSLAGCSDSQQAVQPGEPTQVQSAKNQLEAVRMAADHFLSNSKPGVLNPEQLYQDIIQGKGSRYYLVDIRANQDFVSSNIYGSVNIPYNQTVNPEKLAELPEDKILVVVDYNGHWAAQTAATWNQLGYQAVPLRYGLQSWTREGAPVGYEMFPGQALKNPLDMEETAFTTYDLPEAQAVQDSPEEYIRTTAERYLNRNYKGYIEAEEMSSALQGNPDNEHFLVDIRSREHYRSGHLAGAIHIPLAELAKPEMLSKLPGDRKIILIGYDGMDASQAARVLVTLGYDAVALKYGMSYWYDDEQVTGISPISNLVKEYYELKPLNYLQPSTGAAGCG